MMELVKVLSFKRVKGKGLNPCDNLGNLIFVLVISYPLRIWQFGYLAIDRNEQYGPKMFLLMVPFLIEGQTIFL